MMNGKIVKKAKEVFKLPKRLLQKRRYIEKVKMPKGVKVFY